MTSAVVFLFVIILKKRIFMRHIEKRASGLLMSGLAAGLVHGTQNAALLRKLHNNTLHETVLKTLRNRASGANANVLDGVKNSLIPEIGVLADHTYSEGNRIRNMRNRDRVIAVNMLKGNLSRVLGSKNIRKRAIGLLKQNPKTKDYADMVSSLERLGLLDDKKSLHALEKLYKSDPLTRNIAKLTDAVSGKHIQTLAKGSPTTKKEGAGEIAGNLLFAAAEPVAAGMNVTKRLIADHESGKSFGPAIYNLLNKAREGSNSIFIKKPVKKSFLAGLGGKYQKGAVAKNNALKISGNAILASGADFAGKVGRLAREEAARIGGASGLKAVDVAAAAAEAAEKKKKRSLFKRKS